MSGAGMFDKINGPDVSTHPRASVTDRLYVPLLRFEVSIELDGAEFHDTENGLKPPEYVIPEMEPSC